MRVLYHHRTRLEDAQGIHVAEMVRAFRDLGHEVEVVSLVDNDGPAVQRQASSFARLTESAPAWVYELMSLGYNFYGYRRLQRAIAMQRPDLIYERYSLNTLCGVWASHRFGIPLILEVNAPLRHEQEQLGQLRFRRLARRSERWVCANSTRTIVVSRVMRDMLCADGVPFDHVSVMHNGIDPHEFNPSLSGATVRDRYGLTGKVVVGVVGWFRKWHGVEMLLEVMHTQGLLTPDVRLLLVGDGPVYPDLVRYVEANQLQDSVVLAGAVRRAEIPAHVAAMDITVQPSATSYACPMKIIEYMAAARCIVAPDQPNIRELLDDRRTALLFPSGDRHRLATVIAEALRDPHHRTALGQGAHERVVERGLFWRTNAERVIDLARGQGTGSAPLRTRVDAQTSPVSGRLGSET